MHAKLISSGMTVLAKEKGDCLTGGTPTRDCLYIGYLPYGNCIQGHG
jgi:hypothetical protein